MNSFQTFDPSSRIWIYQSNRLLTVEEAIEIKNKAAQFTDQWTAHQQLLKAAFDLQYDIFLIFCVDEKSATASGCSIDKSLHLIQQLEKEYNIRLLDRKMAAYISDDKAVPFHLNDLSKLYSEGVIKDDTIVCDNLVNTLEDFKAEWHIPLQRSWIKQMIKISVPAK